MTKESVCVSDRREQTFLFETTGLVVIVALAFVAGLFAARLLF